MGEGACAGPFQSWGFGSVFSVGGLRSSAGFLRATMHQGNCVFAAPAPAAGAGGVSDEKEQELVLPGRDRLESSAPSLVVRRWDGSYFVGPPVLLFFPLSDPHIGTGTKFLNFFRAWKRKNMLKHWNQEWRARRPAATASLGRRQTRPACRLRGR